MVGFVEVSGHRGVASARGYAGFPGNGQFRAHARFSDQVTGTFYHHFFPTFPVFSFSQYLYNSPLRLSPSLASFPRQSPSATVYWGLAVFSLLIPPRIISHHTKLTFSGNLSPFTTRRVPGTNIYGIMKQKKSSKKKTSALSQTSLYTSLYSPSHLTCLVDANSKSEDASLVPIVLADKPFSCCPGDLWQR